MHLKTGISPQTYTCRPTNVHLSPRILLILSHYLDPKPFKRCFLKHTKQQQGAYRPPSLVVDFLYLNLIFGGEKEKND